jgi:hypothetical protein
MRPALLLLPILALAACTQATVPQPEAAGTSPDAPHAAPASAATPADAVAGGPDTPVSSPAVAPPESGVAVRTDGYGALRFGMSADEARAAWPGGLKGDEVTSDNCGYLRPADAADFRIAFMFEAGKFVRYDVGVAGETAPGGGRAGQSRADIERLYAGRAEARPHAYVAGGHYLRIADAGVRDGAVVFETDAAGRVTRWRAGRAPQVDYVEGCS